MTLHVEADSLLDQIVALFFPVEVAAEQTLHGHSFYKTRVVRQRKRKKEKKMAYRVNTIVLVSKSFGYAVIFHIPYLHARETFSKYDRPP